jgi:hypothetical protein
MAEKVQPIHRGNYPYGHVGHNLTPGMDHEMQREDAVGYSTDMEMLTGGVLADAMACGGPEVGNPRDRDPMGEEYNPLTWDASMGMPTGSIGGGQMAGDGGSEGDRGVESTKQGGNMAMSPQVYSKYSKRGDY